MALLARYGDFLQITACLVKPSKQSRPTAYDFRGCICDQTIKEQIRQNGGLIESAVEEELATAQGIMDENPVLAHSPGDIRRAGQTVEQYLSGFSEEEHVKYKEYYKDELP